MGSPLSMNLALSTIALGLLTAASAGAAQELSGSSCRLYGDAVGSYMTSHGEHGISVYLKTPINDAQGRANFDGKVVKVVFFGTAHAVGGSSADDDARTLCNGLANWDPVCKLLGKWGTMEGALTPGSPNDYWMFYFGFGNSFTFERQFEGAFYAETEKGTHYWLNADGVPGKNFFLDYNTEQDVARVFGQHYSLNRENANQTAGSGFTYLNPENCITR